MNPIDYSMWEILQRKRTKHASLRPIWTNRSSNWERNGPS